CCVFNAVRGSIVPLVFSPLISLTFCPPELSSRAKRCGGSLGTSRPALTQTKRMRLMAQAIANLQQRIWRLDRKFTPVQIEELARLVRLVGFELKHVEVGKLAALYASR